MSFLQAVVSNEHEEELRMSLFDCSLICLLQVDELSALMIADESGDHSMSTSGKILFMAWFGRKLEWINKVWSDNRFSSFDVFPQKKMVGTREEVSWVKRDYISIIPQIFVGVTFNDVGVKVFPQRKLKLNTWRVCVCCCGHEMTTKALSLSGQCQKNNGKLSQQAVPASTGGRHRRVSGHYFLGYGRQQFWDTSTQRIYESDTSTILS